MKRPYTAPTVVSQEIHEVLPCVGGPFRGFEVPVQLGEGQPFVDLAGGERGEVRARYLVERVDGVPHHLTHIGASR